MLLFRVNRMAGQARGGASSPGPLLPGAVAVRSFSTPTSSPGSGRDGASAFVPVPPLARRGRNGVSTSEHRTYRPLRLRLMVCARWVSGPMASPAFQLRRRVATARSNARSFVLGRRPGSSSASGDRRGLRALHLAFPRLRRRRNARAGRRKAGTDTRTSIGRVHLVHAGAYDAVARDASGGEVDGRCRDPEVGVGADVLTGPRGGNGQRATAAAPPPTPRPATPAQQCPWPR
jgi:hypothetical protein